MYALLTRCAFAQETRPVEFDAAFLPGAGAMSLDLSRYAKGNPILAGTYDVDLYLNGEWQERRSVRFASHASEEAAPCIDWRELERFGVSPMAIATPAAGDTRCDLIAERISDATVRFDVSEQRLEIEVPQAHMSRRDGRAVPADQWQRGTVAGLLGWRINGYRGRTPGGTQRSLFASVDAGINAGVWRFRHAGTWSGNAYRRGNSYVERQLAGWRSQLRIGDVVVADDLFDAARLRGVTLRSDTRMDPGASSGYVPVVRGMATTHATVRVSQHGTLLRELTVPPGPFVIDDILGTGGGGDLDVEVTGDDLRVNRFRVPFFSMPGILGEGQSVHSVGVGSVAREATRRGRLAQATWHRGIRNGVTASSGWRALDRQVAAAGGVAFDTLAGAVAFDVTRFFTVQGAPGGFQHRLRYGRQWNNGTVLSASLAQGRDAANYWSGTRARERGAASRHLNVLLQRRLTGEGGSLGLGWSRAVFTPSGVVAERSTLSWARSWRDLALDASGWRSRERGQRHGARRSEWQAQLSLSMPLERLSRGASLHSATSLDRTGAATRLGMGGTVGEDGRSSYGASLARERGGNPRVDASLSRMFSGGEVGIAAEHSKVTKGISLSASGGVVIHAGGITFAQRLGDGMALVHAVGASGARVASATGIQVNKRGYALLPYLAPFRWNAVDLDPTGLPLDVTLVTTHRLVAPTAGAVVLVPFESTVARTLLVTARRPGGRLVPFGAEVADDTGRSVGTVGQGGQLFLRLALPAAGWVARWAEGEGGQCDLRLQGPVDTVGGVSHQEGLCE